MHRRQFTYVAGRDSVCVFIHTANFKSYNKSLDPRCTAWLAVTWNIKSAHRYRSQKPQLKSVDQLIVSAFSHQTWPIVSILPKRAVYLNTTPHRALLHSLRELWHQRPSLCLLGLSLKWLKSYLEFLFRLHSSVKRGRCLYLASWYDITTCFAKFREHFRVEPSAPSLSQHHCCIKRFQSMTRAFKCPWMNLYSC